MHLLGLNYLKLQHHTIVKGTHIGLRRLVGLAQPLAAFLGVAKGRSGDGSLIRF